MLQPSDATTPDGTLARPLVIAVTIPQDLLGRCRIGTVYDGPGKIGAHTAGIMPRNRGRKGPKIPASQVRPVRQAPPASVAPSLTPNPALGYDPSGPMQQRSVIAAKDGWSEYTLDDGTILRTRNAVIDVKQAIGQYNAANGDPIYLVQGASIINVEAPAHLKKKAGS
jgi:hypothetical protein